MSRPTAHRRAFTLLELLVALAMTAVLAGSLYATLRVAFRAKRTATEHVDRVRRGELAAQLMRRDLESAVVPKGILAGIFNGEDRVGQDGSDRLVLHATGSGAQQKQGRGDIRMIEFTVVPDSTGRSKNLVRRVTWNLLSTRTLEAEEEVLCRGVRTFNLRYFDGVDWYDYWDSSLNDNVLPAMVEIVMELIDPDSDQTDQVGHWVIRMVRLPCSSLTAGLQTDSGMGGLAP